MSRQNTLPGDVYRRTYEIARAYDTLRGRRGDFEGVDKVYQAKINQWQIQAIEDAWWAASMDDFERVALRKNVFEGVPMHYIDVPLSISAIKRLRLRFFTKLAENLGFW